MPFATSHAAFSRFLYLCALLFVAPPPNKAPTPPFSKSLYNHCFIVPTSITGNIKHESPNGLKYAPSKGRTFGCLNFTEISVDRTSAFACLAFLAPTFFTATVAPPHFALYTVPSQPFPISFSMVICFGLINHPAYSPSSMRSCTPSHP